MNTQTNRSSRKKWVILIALLLIPILCIVIVAAVAYPARARSSEVLTDNLSEPLSEITTAKMDIDTGDGNLTIDWLTGGEPLLAGGTLQYLKDIGLPAHSLSVINHQATYSLIAGEGSQIWRRLPWAACNGATEWQIHLNPAVQIDLTAHTDGGNLKLDLSGLTLSAVSADTGGGNIEMGLPEADSDLDVTARTGAGNVIVRLPENAAARVHVSTGLGKAIVDPRFQQVDDTTYQTPGYDTAASKVEVTAESGAGNIEIQFQ